jgi:hypothetical protein
VISTTINSNQRGIRIFYSDNQQVSYFEKRDALFKNDKWGCLNPELPCPHCQTKGHIRTQIVGLRK